MVSLCSADVDVIVNLAGADIVVPDPVQALPGFLDFSSMDNSDLFVAMCLPGTFSPDHEGICHDCVKCQADQYEKLACIPTRDRTCANCTVCGQHDLELCQCSVKTAQCVTGDRVCVKVPPTVVNLVVDFTSNGVLTNKQQIFVRSGLAVGYTDWLALQFDVDAESVELTDFVRTGSLTYKAYFRFNEVYGEAKVRQIQSQNEEFFQGGIYYTFGDGRRRRRLLEAGDASRRLLGVGTGYLTANGVSSSCEIDTNCTEPFTAFQFGNDTQCTGSCMPVPCPPGYSGAAKDCRLCEPGTFKNASGYGDCDECPAGSTSPTGSNSSDACVAVTTSASAAETTTTTPPPSQTTQYTSSAASSSSTSATSQQATSSPTQTSSALSASPSTSSAPPSSTSSAPPSTASPPPPPPPGTASVSTAPPQIQQTSLAPSSSSTGAPSGGTGSSSSGGGSGSSVNTNTNTNNIHIEMPAININVPAPPPPPPIYIQIASPPAPPPIFNNNVVIHPPAPAPRMTDARDDYGYYRRHGYRYYDGDDDLLGDWGLMFLLFVFLFAIVAIPLCMYYPGCGCAGCYGDSQAPPRHVVRYEIVRQRDRDERDRDAGDV